MSPGFDRIGCVCSKEKLVVENELSGENIEKIVILYNIVIVIVIHILHAIKKYIILISKIVI